MNIALGKREKGSLTEGPIMRTLLQFAIPVVLTNLIQQLYGMVDLIIAGKFIGSIGTVGVSVGGEVADLIVPVAVGFATAGQIYIAQLAGARDEEQIKSTVGTLLTFSTLASLVIMAVTIGSGRLILQLLNCPEEAMGQAIAYMILTAVGFPFIFAYNAVCGVLRGLGESQKPLEFIIVAAVINIVLDLLLVAGFDLQASGTAIATTASQIGAFGAAFYYMWKNRERFDFELKPSYFQIKPDALWILIKLGVPQVVRTLLVRFSMLWVNASVNAYGMVISETNNLGNKIQKFAELYIQGVDTASAAMIGQNLGARKPERAKKVVWCALVFTMTCAAVVSALALICPRGIFGIFTNNPEVLDYSVIYLKIMIIHFFTSAFIGPFQAMVTGCGFVSLGFAIGILDGVVCKIGLSLIFVNIMQLGAVGYFWGIACSRILPALLCFGYFMSGKWRTRKLLTRDGEAAKTAKKEEKGK